MKTWNVKALTYNTPGKASWETIKTFNSPAEADAWLANFIRENNACYTDYTISTK